MLSRLILAIFIFSLVFFYCLTPEGDNNPFSSVEEKLGISRSSSEDSLDNSQSKTIGNPQTTVYITGSGEGEKYHRIKNCRTLSRSDTVFSISLKSAVNQGYTACKVCKPPVSMN